MLGFKENLDSKLQKIIDSNQVMYSAITDWNAIYKGIFDKFNKIEDFTIAKGTFYRNIKTFNLPKKSSEYLAKLIFSEDVVLKFSGKDAKIVEELTNKTFKENKFLYNMPIHAEKHLALGGMVVKSYPNKNKNKKYPKISFSNSLQFLPTAYDEQDVEECVLASVKTMNGKHYTRLEYHETDDTGNYVIRYELYESRTKNDKGIKVPLKVAFPNLQEKTVLPNTQGKLFYYSKNNISNNIDEDSPLGVSIFNEALSVYEIIIEAIDSYKKEFKYGKKKILISSKHLAVFKDPLTKKMRRMFDPNNSIYEAFADDTDKQEIKDITLELRVEEHIAGINSLIELYSMMIGVSAGTFTFDGVSMKTATEIVSEDKTSFQTKQYLQKSFDLLIKETIRMIIEVAILMKLENFAQYKGVLRPEYQVEVNFSDSLFIDDESEYTKDLQKVKDGLLSKRTFMERWERLSPDELEIELKRIEEEEAKSRMAWEGNNYIDNDDNEADDEDEDDPKEKDKKKKKEGEK